MGSNTLRNATTTPPVAQAGTEAGRIMHALALRMTGAKWKDCREVSGCELSTPALVERYQKSMSPEAPDAEKAREVANGKLLAGAYAVAVPGLAQMAAEVDSLAPDERRAHTLAAARVLDRAEAGAAGTNQARAFGEGIAAAMERLLGEGGPGVHAELTIEPASREPRTITAEPVTVEPVEPAPTDPTG